MTKARPLFSLTLFITLLLLLDACSKVPVTGRRQVNLLPESQLMGMSLTQYDQFLKENPTVPDSDPRTQQVKRVGNNIAEAATAYLKKHMQQKRVKNFEWEFNLVDQDVVNAWCMPGGKVCFYTGILPVTVNETGLAVVMGHEVAHAIARHGNERMSQQMAIQLGGIGLATAMESQPETIRSIFLASYGVGSQLGQLKYSRKHESEADKMGLVFMAMAGYNPEEAISFWERMKAVGGQEPPEFMSTHPNNDTRIEDLKAYMPEAMKYYKKNQ